MAGNFADQLRQNTLSANDFTNETKKMIDEALEKNIANRVSDIKNEILKKLSLGQFKNINNKKSICGYYTIKPECWNSFPIFKSEQLEKIRNANLLSYLHNEYIYFINDDHKLGNPIVSTISIHPNETSLWHRFANSNTSWTGNFTFSRAAINYIKRINEALRK